MSIKIDPALVQMFAENVRAEVLPRPGTMKLDPAIIQKIAQRVPVFAGMSPACLMATLSEGDHYVLRGHFRGSGRAKAAQWRVRGAGAPGNRRVFW
jgi:hypothetical protein